MHSIGSPLIAVCPVINLQVIIILKGAHSPLPDIQENLPFRPIKPHRIAAIPATHSISRTRFSNTRRNISFPWFIYLSS